MGKVVEMNKSFILNFKHLSARCTVLSVGGSYRAFIVFPDCYMAKGYNHYAIPELIAGNISDACQLAAVEFKSLYAALDARISQINNFNFFVSRMRFRTILYRDVLGTRFAFVATRQAYAITENVDGKKWAKTKFVEKELCSTYNALFFINYQTVFHPLHVMGFNSKFIYRLLRKYDVVKAHHLRIWDDGECFDEIVKYPERLADHVVDHKEDFVINLGLLKQRKKGL